MSTHPEPPHEKESSFAKWKKRFTSKSKPKLDASPAALTLLNAGAISRVHLQRSLQRQLRIWKEQVEAIKTEERMKKIKLAAAVVTSNTNVSGLGQSLAAGYLNSSSQLPSHSPTSHQRSMSAPGAEKRANLSPLNITAVQEGDEDDDSEESGVPIPSRRADSTVVSPTSAYSSSPALPSMILPSSSDGTMPPRLRSGSQSGENGPPRRRLSSAESGVGSVGDDTANSVGSAGAAAAKHLALNSPWSSARPMRPSIILRPSALAISLMGENGEPASPKSASRRSTVTSPGQRYQTMPSPIIPASPARAPLLGTPPPPNLVPRAMKAHPRGSVMLGNIKEWNHNTLKLPPKSADHSNASTPRKDASSDNLTTSTPSDHPPSPLSTLSPPPLVPSAERHVLVMSRWRGLIRQIMALSLWAKRRTSSRHSLAVPTAVRDLAKKELMAQEEVPKASMVTPIKSDDDAATQPPSPIPSPSTIVQAGLTPKNTLLDYFLIFNLPTTNETVLTLKEDLRTIATTGNGLTSRRSLEQLVHETNEKLQADSSHGQLLEVSMRYPLEDRPNFPMDAHWSQFGFQEGVTLSVTPRVTQCYSSVMTLADGLALFATYFKFDVPLLADIPHSFHPSTSAPSGDPKSHVHFFDDLSAKPVAPTPVVPPIPGPDPLTRHWSSPTSPSSHHLTHTFHPQVYTPYCLVLISHYPQFEVLRTIAAQLFEVACLSGTINSPHHDHGKTSTLTNSKITLESYLRALCFEIPLPIPRKYAIRFKIHRALCTIQFPGLRNPTQSSLNLDFLFELLNVDNIIGILAAMLTEHRILFHSTSLNLLTYTMQCFLQLFYPFQFWYSFVPCLTEEMLDACDIPQPFMLGIHSKHLSYLQQSDGTLSEVLIVDLDHDVLRSTQPLTPLPVKDGRELWTSWRRSFEKIQRTKYDQVEDIRYDHEASASERLGAKQPAHGRKSSLNHVTMSNNLRRSSFIMSPPLSSAQHDSGVAAVAAPTTNHPSATSIAQLLPAAAFNFDEEIYTALMRFYADLLIGYRKFLFFIQDVPFFNAQGFLTQRISRDPSSLAFFQKFVASRAFDVFIEEEVHGDPYHEYLATGTPINKIQTILLDDFGPVEKILEIPDPKVEGGGEDGDVTAHKENQRVEVNVKTVGPDEMLTAIVMVEPLSTSLAHGVISSIPFSTPLTPISATAAASTPLRSFHWLGLESDLQHYNFSLTQPQPRKPKQLTSSSEGSMVLGEVFSPSSEGNMFSGSGKDSKLMSSPDPKSQFSSTEQPAGAIHARAHSGGKKTAHHHDAHASGTSASSGENRVKQLMSQIFSSQILSKEEMKDFTTLLNDPVCRRVFSLILSQPKQQPGTASTTASTSSLCLTPVSFEQLSTLVKALLDACLISKDYTSATSGALDIGNVYYSEESKKNHARTYLESTMKKHPIWQLTEFWRANLAHALAQRALKMANAANIPGPTSSAPSSPNPGLSASNSTAASNVDDEFILQWMISAAHLMMSNNVPYAKVEDLMKEICSTHHLKQESSTTILHFLSKIKEAAQYW